MDDPDEGYPVTSFMDVYKENSNLMGVFTSSSLEL